MPTALSLFARERLHLVRHAQVPELARNVVSGRVEVVEGAGEAGRRILVEYVVDPGGECEALVEEARNIVELDIAVEPVAEAVGDAATPILRQAPAPVPAELGDGLRAIVDDELRACLTSLAGQVAATTGPPRIDGPVPMPSLVNIPKVS